MEAVPGYVDKVEMSDHISVAENAKHPFQSTIAFVVPTMNRPAELRRLLASVESQSALPDEIIIVDGSSEPVDRISKDFPRLSLKYLRVFPPGLTKQRNAGMAMLSPHITLAACLDDDLVLEPGSIEAMLRFWDNASKDIGGASFNIVNVRSPRALLIKSLFRKDSFRRGAVMRSGYGSRQYAKTLSLSGFAVVRLSGGGKLSKNSSMTNGFKVTRTSRMWITAIG